MTEQFKYESEPISSYSSPFFETNQDFHRSNSPFIKEIMEYKKPMTNLFDELQSALSDTGSRDSSLIRSMHPARIIRGIIDCNLKMYESAKFTGQAIELGISVFQGNPEAPDILSNLKSSIQNSEPSWMRHIVTQTCDTASWTGTDPQLSIETAHKIHAISKGAKIAMISVGHGSTAAALDVFANYMDLTRTGGSELRVIRFSANKHKDRFPQASMEELNYLKELSRTRPTFLFDEDIGTGGTIKSAYKFFTEKFEKPVIPVVNYDPDGYLQQVFPASCKIPVLS